MRLLFSAALSAFLCCALSSPLHAQASPSPAQSGSGSGGATSASSSSANDANTIAAAVKKDTAPDLQLQIGIGSLIRNGGNTDYVNNANTLSATTLGWATPQYLVGIAATAPFPNFKNTACNAADAVAADAADTVAQAALKKDETDANAIATAKTTTAVKAAADAKSGAKTANPANCLPFRRRPWAGFVSLKFAPDSSQTLNGYVFGGTYALTSYLNVLVGYALTPVNQPSVGLRSAAALYVKAQQQLGNLLNFDPVAMQANKSNAFDGFSLADPTGKLIYTGTPLETYYHGGAVVGISVSADFGSFFKGK